MTVIGKGNLSIWQVFNWPIYPPVAKGERRDNEDFNHRQVAKYPDGSLRQRGIFTTSMKVKAAET
ncbi:hypothetical protein C9426_33065 [Serratia sp. S1B]|nr:hypothetical protein C9426_33065 [Serratia sp. S1B]